MHQDRTLKLASSGISLTEYALILLTGCLLGVAGIQVLGLSEKSLFHTAGTLESRNTLNLLDRDQTGPANGSSSKTAATGNYYALTRDSVTGQPALKLASGAEGASANVSSIDGIQAPENAYGSIAFAGALSRLADEQTSPQTAVYYKELAKWLYYTGCGEGTLDNVSTLDDLINVGKHHQDYTKADALRDIQHYQQTLKDLLDHPPAGVRTEDVAQIRPLINQALRIAQQYLHEYNQYLGKNGKVDQKVNHENKKEQMVNKSLDQLVSYQQMKTIADQALDAGSVGSEMVETTWENAATVSETTP